MALYVGLPEGSGDVDAPTAIVLNPCTRSKNKVVEVSIYLLYFEGVNERGCIMPKQRKKQSRRRTGLPDGFLAFGPRLRKWRQGQELPLKHVADDLGVSISVLSQWERGLRYPSIRNLARVAEYMGVPLGPVFCDRKDCPYRAEARTAT
jgi:hypothetical protein